MDQPAAGAEQKFHQMISGIIKDPVDTGGQFVHTSWPQQLVVEMTSACNQGCIFCGRTYMERPKGHMPRAIFNKIVEEIGAESPYTELWPAFMGESMLLGNELFDRLKYAREAGCKKITLNTNGTLLTDEAVHRVVEGNWDRLIVSCDAHTAGTHALVRPGRKTRGLPGIYESVLSLLALMKERGLNRPIIEMQFSIFSENEHEVEDFTHFWLEKGVVVKTRPKVYWSGLVEGGEPRVTTGKDREPCLWAMDTACIHAGGNVVMCALDSEGKYVAGNVEFQSLRDIWNGPLKWIRELHMRRRFQELPEICRKCPDWQVKRANAHFPSPEARADYEAYIRTGRVFMQKHQALAAEGV